VKAYESGDFPAAAVAFRQAYELVTNYKLLWNIGRAWEKAGELEKARDRYRELLSLDSADAELRQKAGDALVRVGKALGLRERPEPAPAPSLPPPPAPEPEGPSLSLWGWVGLGVGLAAAGTGAALLAVAEGKRGEAQDILDSAEPVEGQDMRLVTGATKGEAQALIADADALTPGGIAALAVGGALVAAGVTLVILDMLDEGDGDVAFGIAPSPDGLTVGAMARF